MVLEDGVPDQESADLISRSKIGFSLPLILSNGEEVDLSEIIDDPRLVADYRSVFNFATGKQVPTRFWPLFRKP